MKKILMFAVLAFALLCCSTAEAQNPYRPRRPVYYYPVVVWYNTGTFMNAGPVRVGPNRRYVSFGINANFIRYNGYQTFNYGQRSQGNSNLRR